jgi:hypothetical protein
MSESGTSNRAGKDSQLEEALAVLISCTRSKTRPLPLPEIARWLEIAVSKLGSYSAVAERIGLSGKMLGQFASVRRLSPGVKRLFEKRELDSVDAATHLAMLPMGKQIKVANALARGEIDTNDVRAVVELWRAGRSVPFDHLIRRVRDSKTKQEYVAEFVVRGDRDRGQILAAFKEYVPLSEIIRLELEGALGRLVLTQKGKQALVKAAKTLHTPIKHVIPAILEGWNRT